MTISPKYITQTTDIPSQETSVSHQSPYTNAELLPGIGIQRYALSSSQLIMDSDKLPESFPMHLWESQAARYRFYWNWFTGRALAQELGRTKDGKEIEKFPLRINAVRNFSRKHAALLFGEIPDNPRPLVKTKIRPRPSLLNPSEPVPTDKKNKGEFYGRVVDSVWEQSGGSTLLYENGILSQFLGGCFFYTRHVPWRTDLSIPIQIERIMPDFVLPIWDADDPFSLNECWVMYRIASATVNRQFGLNVEAPWVTYLEHWDKYTHSIMIDGQPLIATYQVPGAGPVDISFDKQPHNLGFVPIRYIPRLREGDFYGSSFIPDVIGLLKEFNGRWADIGTIIQKTAHRRWIGRNITGSIKPRQFDNGHWFTDLGPQNPALNNPPELWPEDSPNYSEFFMNNVEELFEQLLKEGNLTKVAYGYVDGTQRSGETLKALMWPSTAIARAQRVNWGEGLSRVAIDVLTMMHLYGISVEGNTPPLHIHKEFTVQQDWLPILPKDREQVVSEVSQLGLSERPIYSLERSLDMLGDVDDPDDEIQRIYNHMREVQAIMSEAQIDVEEAKGDIQGELAEEAADRQKEMVEQQPSNTDASNNNNDG